MNVLIICCLAMMGIIFLCLLYRLVVHYQLNRINVKQTSILFQTKLNHFKQRELLKSFMILFVSTMGLITVLSFAILQMFQMETQVQGVRANNRSLQGELKKLQKKKSTKNLLKEYPSSGLELEKTLTGKDQTVASKVQIEKALSEKLMPYIEDANFVLSNGSDSDSVKVLLSGSIEATNANLVILGQNIAELMREIEGIKTVTEVHITIVDREGNDVYKGTHMRNEKGQFTFQSEMRKGKG